MLRDDAVQLIAVRLGKRTDLDAAIITEMQFVQSTKLEGSAQFLPWFLETELAAATCTVGDDRLPFPTDFLGEIEGQALWCFDAEASPSYTALVKKDYDYLLEKFPGAGKPKAYAVRGVNFLLRPVPDAAYIFKMSYYGRDVALTTNITNKWLSHAADLVIAEVGAIMAGKYLQNQQLAEQFKADAAEARQRLFVKHESMQHTNRFYQMGED